MLINTLEIIIPTNKVSKIQPYTNNYLYFSDVPKLDLNLLKEYLTKMNDEGNNFLNLIISCSEEISYLTIEQIANLLVIIQPFYHLFKYKYIRTNGELMKLVNNIKFAQIYLDFTLKIQRYYLNDIEDNIFFQRPAPNIPMHDFANFSYSKICWDIICLKESSYESITTLMDLLIDRFNNFTTEFCIVSPKIYGFNVNALTIKEMEFSNWILNFGFRSYADENFNKNFDDDLLDYMNLLTKNKGLEFKEYWEWEYRGKRITMNKPTNLQLRFNKHHIFYGDKLIDYNGNELILN